MGELPEFLAALTLFGLLFVLPVIHLMLRHQRAMAEILHRTATSGSEERILALEHEVRELRAAQYRQIIEQDAPPVTLSSRS